MIEQLTTYSDSTGKTCTGYDVSASRLGPYLRKMPNDSVSGKGAVAADITQVKLGTPLVAAETGGWKFDNKSGQIINDNTALDSRGAAYSTH